MSISQEDKEIELQASNRCRKRNIIKSIKSNNLRCEPCKISD